MKSIFILGASVLQVPAIKKAKEKGLFVYVLDYNPEAVGIQYADKFLCISTIDKQAVYEAALEYKPDFIITSTSDMPVATVAWVNEKLEKKIDISYKDAICATNKAEMRKRLQDFEVPIPKFYICNDFNEFEKAVKALNYHCVIKPSDNAASRGVYLIDKEMTSEELLDKYNNTESYTRNHVTMVEEFMTGKEVSVESFIINKEPFIVTITDKLVTPLPYFVELGHSEPSMLPNDIQDEIKSVTKKAIKAIGIINGVSHAELKITSEGPKIVEIAARLGGDNITSKLVPLSTGIDMVGNSVYLSLSEPIDIERKITKGSAIRYIVGKKGIIKDIKIERNPLEIKGVKEFVLDAKIGDNVNDVKSSNDRLGYIVTQADTAKEAVEIAEYAVSLITIQIN